MAQYKPTQNGRKGLVAPGSHFLSLHLDLPLDSAWTWDYPDDFNSSYVSL